ncbi:MAG: AcrB/AcrD/AcrF family protein [Helicobacteraceae bacterium]|nr:AcrB/AcrD/AcrF family protein [Helicobacteraceae bacterium]
MKKDNFNIAGKLASGFIDHPLTALLGVFILVLGYLTLEIIPREENPQIKVAGGVVIVALPGASASEVQKVITDPLEKKIREIKGVENIFSTARDSVGIVQVQYYVGQDKSNADLKLYDIVMKNMDQLPKNAMNPIIKTMDIDIDVPVASIAFYAKDDAISQTELYKKINRLGYEINRINDVAQVALKGARKEQFNVSINASKLKAKKITLGQVAMSLKGLTFQLPNIQGETTSGDVVIFGVDSAIDSVNDVKNILISSFDGRAVYLKDIAEVTKGDDIQNKKRSFIYSKENNLEAKETQQVTMTISKLKGANTVIVNEKIFAYLDSVKNKLETENIGYIITRDDGYTANHAVNELVYHLVVSIAIIAILLVFALGFKEAMIVSITVPMILSLTLFIGFMIGETVNRITLFALLLSLGLLVDAAIIVIENIHRHMHDHSAKDKTLREIAIEATNEIGNPTNVATIAIIMTFVPMFFVGGMMGQFMHPLPVFVPIALLVSLVIAYIFTPYLVNKFLKKVN